MAQEDAYNGSRTVPLTMATKLSFALHAKTDTQGGRMLSSTLKSSIISMILSSYTIRNLAMNAKSARYWSIAPRPEGPKFRSSTQVSKRHPFLIKQALALKKSEHRAFRSVKGSRGAPQPPQSEDADTSLQYSGMDQRGYDLSVAGAWGTQSWQLSVNTNFSDIHMPQALPRQYSIFPFIRRLLALSRRTLLLT